ncbi:MAG: hypothetical protein WBD47_19480 [Phormidesmis sp.]
MSQQKSSNQQRFKQLSVVMLGAYVLSGCPSSANNTLLSNQGPLAQEAIAQETLTQDAIPASAENVVPASVPFEVCADVDSWQRPSEAEQAKQLDNDDRYGEVLAEGASEAGAFKSASTLFWDHQIISFTTYGLSARLEPVNLSGLWTVADDMWNCYEPETTVAINEGDRAEAWLLNHRVSDLSWQGDRYVMTVEPAATGMQVVLFNRVDELTMLPLEVVSATGEPIAVMSGDWQ